MRRVAFFFVLLVAVSTLPVTASSERPSQVGLAAPASQQEVAQDLLFFELQGPGGLDRLLGVSYSVNGDLLFTERIELRQPESETSPSDGTRAVAVELLAWHPEIRGRLLEANSRGSLVTVIVSPLDGSSFSFVLEELITHSHELQAAGLRAAPNRSEVIFSAISLPARSPSESGSSLSAKSTCEEDCDYDLYLCEFDCGGTGYDEQCYYNCDLQYQWCLDDCQGCTEPTIEQWTESQVISNVYIGPAVCRGNPGFTGIVAEYRYLKIKYTTYRKTTYCDGSSTTEVIGVTYYDGNCWALTGFCGSAVGFVDPVCPI